MFGFLAVPAGLAYLAVSADKHIQRETPVEIANRIRGESTIVVIDDCQYIFMEHGNPRESGYAFSLTHKGNCTNHSK